MARRRRALDDDDQHPPKKLSRESVSELLFLFKFLYPYRVKFFGSLVLLFFSSVTTLTFPYIIGKLVDAAQPGLVSAMSRNPLTDGMRSNLPDDSWISLDNINTIVLLLLGIVAAQAVVSFLRVIWFIEVGERSMADLRKQLYRHLIILPMAFFANRRVGELASRVSADVSLIQDAFSFTLAEFIRSSINLSVGIVIILFISAKLSLFMLALIPVIVITALVFGRYIRKISKKAQDALADSNVIVEETLQGVLNVKAFGNEFYENKRYGSAIDQLVNVVIQGAKYRGAFISFIIFALFGAIILILWYGANLVQEGAISIGDLTSFLIYTTFVGASFTSLSEYYSQIQKTLGATERVRELMREPGEQLVLEPVEPSARLKGDVSFEQVTFAYPSRAAVEVLHGVTFDVASGQQVAVVGPSGAGKSTLISLILRFYDPSEGRMLIDGRDARTFPLTELRRQMAIVPQDVFLFGGTIRENIAYGNVYATEADIHEAARKANALEFIDRFPEKFETVVGERGVKLSGGQRQRVAIARAVLRNPSILILDEATSSLDSESERLVQEALDELMKGRTTFVIAHRLSTVRKADTIIVLQNGKVVEQGPHETLMSNPDGLYKLLAGLQFASEPLS